jgi:carboxyl-terminal processing protease
MRLLSKFFCTAVLAVGFSSCQKLTEVSPVKDGSVAPGVEVHASNKGKSNETVNSWIYEAMDQFYLWGDKMPTKSATNQALVPDKYFDALLFEPGVTDRFSWMEEDAEALRAGIGGVSTTTGASFQGFYTDQTQTKLILSVRYVIKNSPAEKAGVKRGDIFTRINGTEISGTNVSDLLNSESLVFTYGAMGAGGVSDTDKTIPVSKTSVQNNPVHFSKVITKGSKKIGYVVYNQFVSGVYSSATQRTGTEYDDKLRAIFADFKVQGINELVLDLRFNGGGFNNTERVVGSLIVKGLKPGTIMNKTFWSKNGEAYVRRYWGYGDDDFRGYWQDESSNIGNNISRVYILTSRSTASASEMLINDLKPYMDVVLIGGNTAGKDVGSITLDDSGNDYRWKWGLQPIVLRFVNSIDESGFGTTSGFTPTIIQADNFLPWKEFGEENETLLSVALKHIEGSGNVGARSSRESSPLKMKEGAIFDNKYSNINNLFAEPKDNK